jgi:hypothetical protein
MLHGTEVRVTDGPATVEGQDGPVTRVAITLPEGPAAFGRATVRLAQARATGSRTSRD